MNKVAILTSGGDAPGMNAAIRAFVRTALHHGMEVYGIRDGFHGLYHDDIFAMDRSSVSDTLNRGGTILGTARFLEMLEPEVQVEIANKLKKMGIEGLVVIGGDGSYRGALALARHGIKVIGVPGTIDNDIPSTKLTIGYDTAVNTVVEAIDKLRDTSTSHRRCSIVEVMGRNCGDIALKAGISTGAEAIITSDFEYSFEQLVNLAKEAFASGKQHFLIVITENITNVLELAKAIEKCTKFNSRATILGYIQRGGTPSAIDRYIASLFGAKAADYLVAGKSKICLGTDGFKIYATPIEEALKLDREIDYETYKIAEIIK
ncbi:6-phosphofructokinase [Mycoplasma sp. P36-A1]|uniref:6-phosphofructokinase n=1 Tax=Mycoplasma sp. P36-A1 TaxID=3252900 RepID=UPI003C2B5E71